MLGQLYVELTHTMHSMAFPQNDGVQGNLEALLVLVCVFVSDAEGRPASVSKIAAHAMMPRATVYRKLDYLMKIGKIVKVGRSYCYAPNAITPDIHGKLGTILDRFVSWRVSKLNTYKLATEPSSFRHSTGAGKR